MPNYLFVYYSGQRETPLPDEQERANRIWTDWFQKLGRAVVEVGAPTKPGKTVSRAGARPSGDNAVRGYSVVKANNLGAAVNLAKSHPDVQRGLKIGVYELRAM